MTSPINHHSLFTRHKRKKVIDVNDHDDGDDDVGKDSDDEISDCEEGNGTVEREACDSKPDVELSPQELKKRIQQKREALALRQIGLKEDNVQKERPRGRVKGKGFDSIAGFEEKAEYNTLDGNVVEPFNMEEERRYVQFAAQN